MVDSSLEGIRIFNIFERKITHYGQHTIYPKQTPLPNLGSVSFAQIACDELTRIEREYEEGSPRAAYDLAIIACSSVNKEPDYRSHIDYMMEAAYLDS